MGIFSEDVEILEEDNNNKSDGIEIYFSNPPSEQQNSTHVELLDIIEHGSGINNMNNDISENNNFEIAATIRIEEISNQVYISEIRDDANRAQITDMANLIENYEIFSESLANHLNFRRSRHRYFVLKKKFYKDLTSKINDCLICFEDFKPKSKVYNLSCEHIFHIKCFDKWFRRSEICPVCRKTPSCSYSKNRKK